MQPVPLSGTVRRVSPAAGETLDNNGRKRFAWTALAAGLPTDTGYELVFWRLGEDPMTAGKSPVGAGEQIEVLVDISAADSVLGTTVEPGQATCWGVRLWDMANDRAATMLSDGCRLFVYQAGGVNGQEFNTPPQD